MKLIPFFVFLAGCIDKPSVPVAIPTANPSVQNASPGGSSSDESDVEIRVKGFCGACHAVPNPETFPRDAWYDEVRRGYDFYYQSRRDDLAPPPMQQVVDYFRGLAPDALVMPKELSAGGTGKERFVSEQILGAPSGFPAISHVRWLPGVDGSGSLFACDMSSGNVTRLSRGGGKWAAESLATIANPAHLEPLDLDRDGREDYVIADLGSFMPGDHDRGRVMLVRRPGVPAEVLIDGVGRVADAQPGDFDADGDIDLVIAEFGWQRTGRILLLEQTSASGDAALPSIAVHVLDRRHGAIHVPVIDINHDGHLDFIALISQEHEVVDAFLGRGDGTFEPQRIHTAGDPSYGSSGIQLADFDADGDIDVLYTNGDTLDGQYLKPYHSIQWLENQGTFPFRRHHLAFMPGVYRAVAHDLDEDGDMDVVAGAFFPDSLRRVRENRIASGQQLDALIWLEQTSPQEYARHVLAQSDGPGYLALDVGDFDEDGDTDIATGHFSTQSRPSPHGLSIWWNQGGAAKLTSRLRKRF